MEKQIEEFKTKMEAAIWEMQQAQATFEHEWNVNRDRLYKHSNDEMAKAAAHFSEGYSKGIKHTIEKIQPILATLDNNKTGETK